MRFDRFRLFAFSFFLFTVILGARLYATFLSNDEVAWVYLVSTSVLLAVSGVAVS